MFYIILFILLFLLFKCIFVLKIHIDLKSLFKRGFKKYDNDFGLFCYCGKQGKGKTYSAIKFLIDRKLEKDYQILTNVKSFDIFSDTLYFDNINSIIDYCTTFKDNDKNVIIFFDEIFTILEKRHQLTKISYLLSLNYENARLFLLLLLRNGQK